MIKIKDESGKIVGVLEDNASEPTMKEEKKEHCDKCKCDEKKKEEEGDEE